MERTKNNSYTNVFKIQVVEAAIKLNKKRKTAKNFGIDERNVRRWISILLALKKASRMS